MAGSNPASDRKGLVEICVLEVRNLTKIYRKLEERVEGIENASLKISAGEIIGLIGPNGAGKTTLIKLITTVLEPDSGEILFEGERMDKGSKRKIGYVPENPFFYTNLKGWELARFMESIYQANLEDGGRLSFVQLAKRLNVEEHLGKFVSSYSQGILRKFLLSLAIAFGTRLIILDEPTNGLDPDSYISLKEILKECREDNRAVLIATHQLPMAQEIVDKIAICYNGRIQSFTIKDETVEELYRNIVHRNREVQVK